jgi:hypothetical protein
MSRTHTLGLSMVALSAFLLSPLAAQSPQPPLRLTGDDVAPGSATPRK